MRAQLVIKPYPSLWHHGVFALVGHILTLRWSSPMSAFYQADITLYFVHFTCSFYDCVLCVIVLGLAGDVCRCHFSCSTSARGVGDATRLACRSAVLSHKQTHNWPQEERVNDIRVRLIYELTCAHTRGFYLTGQFFWHYSRWPVSRSKVFWLILADFTGKLNAFFVSQPVQKQSIEWYKPMYVLRSGLSAVQ